MKLWQKDNTAVLDKILDFTVGRDREFDLLLAQHDVEGSLAHTAMLCQAGILSDAEHAQIKAELENILTSIRAGEFQIDESFQWLVGHP